MSRSGFRVQPSASGSQPTAPVELENQFIMRLPEEPAQALREAIRSGASNLKDRLSIQMAPDNKQGSNQYLRRGNVIFDGWSMSAKLMDLPTIIESQKTIDKKTFYKTADICQLLVCKEGDGTDDELDVESPNKKNQKKDPNKVEKRYLFKHGLTPPLKNCRRRRFRKTLRKKNVDAQEIEKEVRRLLRYDQEAIRIKYEVVTEDELNAARGSDANAPGGVGEESNTAFNQEDLFGALSDIDEDEERKDIDIDSEADMSNAATMDDSKPGPSNQPTQFSKEMFEPKPSSSSSLIPKSAPKSPEPVQNPVALKVESLTQETDQLKTRKMELEKNIANCDNLALQQRFQQTLAEVEEELRQKENELENLAMLS